MWETEGTNKDTAFSGGEHLSLVFPVLSGLFPWCHANLCGTTPRGYRTPECWELLKGKLKAGTQLMGRGSFI